MQCPYCHNEMELGWVQSPRPVFWSPTACEAYHCPTCKKIILDLPPQDRD